MAPQKPQIMEPSVSAKKKKKKDEEDDGVVKRPKRGYHTFKNGALNVNPKGAEIAKVQGNQMQSPLLRLPAEIRNQIWYLTLGQITFRQRRVKGRVYAIEPPVSRQPNCLGLLRTCRQIYAEASPIPFETGSFACTRIFSFIALLRGFKSWQRSLITQVELETFGAERWVIDGRKMPPTQKLDILSVLPNLKIITIIAFPPLAYGLRTNYGYQMNPRIDNSEEEDLLMLSLMATNPGVKIAIRFCTADCYNNHKSQYDLPGRPSSSYCAAN